MNDIRRQIATAVADTLGTDPAAVEIEVPENPEHGDYATNAAMRAAGDRGQQPRALAEEVADQLQDADIEGLEDVSVAGPGFINFRVDHGTLGAAIIDGVGDLPEQDPEKIVVEHTSPNPNKPLHMGTMRCAILGDTIARIGSALGHEIEVQDLINDLGRQSASTVYAYQEFLDELEDEERAQKDDFWIGRLYSIAAEHLEEDEAESNRVDAVIQAIEDGDTELAALKDEIVEKSVTGQLQTAFRSNVFYDALIFERDIVGSDLYDNGLEMIKDLDRVRTVEDGEDEGCIVIDIEDFEEELGDLKKPYKILIRSDGTATYVAKDIALSLWKFGVVDTDMGFGEFLEQPNGEALWTSGGEQDRSFGDADRVINVIGAEQKYPQKIIKYSLDSMGFTDEAANFDHMHFKFVYLPGRVAYSGRKGNWVGKHGDAVLDRAHELAREEVEQRHDDLPEDEIEDIAEQVAIAAVRYFILKFTREKEIHFSFEKALDWEGDSGPYLLYSTARANSILRKSDRSDPDFGRVEADEAYALLRRLERFPQMVERAFEDQEPAKLATYLKRLSEDFNSFYHGCPVLDAGDDELVESRLALTRAFAGTMEQGLDLIGIQPLTQM